MEPVLDDAEISIEHGGLYENDRLQRRAIWKLDNDGTVYWADSNDKFGSCSPEEFRAWAKRKVAPSTRTKT
jgi:hypothetical protein